MPSILLKHLKTEQTGNRRIDGFETGFSVTPFVQKGAEVTFTSTSLATTYEYRMYAEIGVTFNANSLELERAKRIALDRIASVLYGPLHGKLSELASAVSDGKRDTCYALIEEMWEMMSVRP